MVATYFTGSRKEPPSFYNVCVKCGCDHSCLTEDSRQRALEAHFLDAQIPNELFEKPTQGDSK